MAFASRRLATLASGTVLAVLGGLVSQAGTAIAADPITSEAPPTLTAPANDPTGATPLKDVVLRWTSVATATQYQVQLSPNGDWTNNTVTLPDNGKTVNTLYEVPISLPHATYFWRVRALHGTAHTAWSAQRTFLRNWVAPFQMIKTPTASDPTLAWEPVAKASLYRVRFSTSQSFDKAFGTVACWTSATSFSPYVPNMAGQEKLGAGGCFDAAALKNGDTYFWEVVAYDDSTAPALVADTTNDGGWECAQAQPECDSSFQGTAPAFTYNPPVAGNPQSLTAPTGLATSWHTATPGSVDCTAGDCPVTPTFSWNPVAQANYYEVHIWRDAAHTNTYRVFDTAFTSLTPRDQFFDARAGTPYFWSVNSGVCRNSSTQLYCAIAPDGTATKSPDCPPASTPASPPTIDGNGLDPTSISGGETTTVTLTGTGFANGACVSAASGAGLISNIQVQSSTTITFTYTAPDKQPETAITFQVVNPDGGTSNQSPVLPVIGTFTKVVLGPAAAVVNFKKSTNAAVLSAPANGATTTNGSVTFSWSDYLATGGQGALDARNYHLQVASDPDFDTVLWDVATIDLTQYTNPQALLPDGTWFWRVQAVDESGNGLTWSATRSLTKDATAPTLRLTNGGGLPIDGVFTIVSDEALKPSTIANLHVASATDGSAVAGTLHQVNSTKWTFTPSSPLRTGDRYQVAAAGVTDAAGNQALVTGAPVRVTTVADDKSVAWQFGSGWTRHSSSNALHGTYVRAAAGHTASLKVVGTGAKLFGCKGPGFGAVKVALDGSPTTVSEHAGFTKCGVLLWSKTLSPAVVHTIKVTVSTGTGTFDEVKVS